MNLKETLKLDAINRTKERSVKRRKPPSIAHEEMIEKAAQSECSRKLHNELAQQLGQGFNQS